MIHDDVLVIVLAGGVGERLFPLTKERAKPAVYFGGPYRIIDFVLSNCLNSGFRRIFIATQYKSLSLNRHIRQGWSIVSEELGEFIEIIPPQKRVGEHWYQGTADAVYQNLYSIAREGPRYVVVLAGDHIYKMDYRKMLQSHIENKADVTLASIEVAIEDGRRFGIVAVDESQRVDRLSGKARRTRIDSWRPASGARVNGHLRLQHGLRSMRSLEEDAADPNSRHDFGRNIIPALLGEEARCSRISSTTRTRKRRNTGATSERWMRITKPTWTCAM